MEKFIKYKRIVVNDIFFIQDTFDDLIKEGWEIIHYNEYSDSDRKIFSAIIICGKKQTVPY